jgi:hypothetical protein
MSRTLYVSFFIEFIITRYYSKVPCRNLIEVVSGSDVITGHILANLFKASYVDY